MRQSKSRVGSARKLEPLHSYTPCTKAKATPQTWPSLQNLTRRIHPRYATLAVESTIESRKGSYRSCQVRGRGCGPHPLQQKYARKGPPHVLKLNGSSKPDLARRAFLGHPEAGIKPRKSANRAAGKRQECLSRVPSLEWGRVVPFSAWIVVANWASGYCIGQLLSRAQATYPYMSGQRMVDLDMIWYSPRLAYLSSWFPRYTPRLPLSLEGCNRAT
ncbi:hypothetical protein BJX66DRAFT_236719 [Aspergillus keveii]|uniref:Uncharacterized protein n=1 Tax=Aspergillus keveii TaxID=714993 RepID=A0ABR4G1C1_9EURO